MKKRVVSWELFLRLSRSGKAAIPYLIEVIDKNERGFVGLRDPKSSTLYLINYNYTGIRSADMIESILANINTKRVYKFCVIVRKINNKPQMEALEYEDMQKIKKIYQKWWEANKSKSMLELQNDWKNGKSPLTGPSYMWQ